jgi:hypothetical protein
MRKWHRWLSVVFGIFILFIAATGVLSQIGSLVNNGGFEQETRERGQRQADAIGHAIVAPAQAHEGEHENEATPVAVTTAAALAPTGFVCPADMTCRPKRTPKPGEWNVGWLHHLHSGEEFGPAGVVISMLSGVALLFFAFSGLWMYVQMFARRSHRKSHPRSLFW